MLEYWPIKEYMCMYAIAINAQYPIIPVSPFSLVSASECVYVCPVYTGLARNTVEGQTCCRALSGEWHTLTSRLQIRIVSGRNVNSQAGGIVASLTYCSWSASVY